MEGRWVKIVLNEMSYYYVIGRVTLSSIHYLKESNPIVTLYHY